MNVVSIKTKINNKAKKNYCAREIDYVDFVKMVNNIIEIVNRNRLFEYA